MLHLYLIPLMISLISSIILSIKVHRLLTKIGDLKDGKLETYQAFADNTYKAIISSFIPLLNIITSVLFLFILLFCNQDRTLNIFMK